MNGAKSNVISMAKEGAVRERVSAILAEGKTSQAQIAREAGMSSGQISHWLKGKYTGDNAATEERLVNWLAARERKAAMARTLPVAPAWKETPIARRIVSVLTYCQMAGDIGCIYGGAGLGKTLTIKTYAEQNPNVWVVEMNRSTCAMASALDEIAYVLNVKSVAGRTGQTHRDLVKRLRDTGGVLVIDEAQHLRTDALEAIRGLHDAAGVGLVLSGNESIYARMTGGGSREATFAQLFSRIGKRLRLVRPAAGDIDPLVGHFGVQGSEERTLCHDIAAKPGALRGLVKTLRLAAMFAAGEEAEAITTDHIRAAWRDLGGDE